MKYNPYLPKGATGAVLETLMGVLNKYPNTYCKVGQIRVIYLLKRMHGIDVCRSTLCAWIRWLRDNKWIVTYQGTHKNRYGKVVYGVCRYYLLPKALNWLKSLTKWSEKVFRHFRVRFSKHNVVHPGRNTFVPRVLCKVFQLSEEIKGRASPSKAFGQPLRGHF